MADVERLIQIYKSIISKNKTLKELVKSAKDWEAVYSYAQGIGDAASQSIISSGTAPEDLEAALIALLRQSHADVSKLCRRVQRLTNDKAGLGIGVIAPELDRGAASKIVSALTGVEDTNMDNLKNMVIKEAMKVVDDSIKQNFEAADTMGLDCKIVRRYDDVGLHDGTKWAKPCQWCLDREGTWNSYQEAYDAGAFERHPGCQCVITYEVGKTRTWSNYAGRWSNIGEL